MQRSVDTKDPVDALTALETARLSPRYWNAAAVALVAAAFEFFDFFIIGFIVIVLSNEWQLSFGQVGAVLYAAGVGAMVGGAFGGWAGSKFGRKWPFIFGIALTALCSGSIAFAPDGAVWYIVLFRFLVGIGVGFMITISQTIMVELTPTRHRTYLAGYAAGGMVPLGTLAAALLSATLLPTLGWRGLAALGAIPVLISIWAVFAVPESPRWLIEQGRTAEAKDVVSKFIGQPSETLTLSTAETASREAQPKQPRKKSRYLELHRYRRGALFLWLAWFGAGTALYGITLWGPTIFSQALDITPADAAELYIWVSLAGFAGRTLFALLPHWIGRRATGLTTGIGGGGILLIGALWGGTTGAAAAVLVISVVAANFFVDGGFVNLAPAGTEIYPTRLRSQAMGLGQVANGLGKIAGPLALALIAGTSNVVTPKATVDAIQPGLIFLAAFALLSAVAFSFFPETRGKSLEEIR